MTRKRRKRRGRAQGRHLHFANDVGELVDKQPLFALPLHPATCPHTEARTAAGQTCGCGDQLEIM